MEQTILRKDVITQLASGEPFDMVYVTCDRRRGTGGDLITVNGWLKVSKDVSQETLPSENIRTGTGLRKDPAHCDHGTVNIFNPENSGVRPHKVHYDLIQFFNGKRVIN